MGTVPFFRRAFTLIEMLVVVTIMMLLIAAAATRMKPATEARRIREAARALEVYLGSARNRAMETGRPCGVVLHRFNGTSAVMNLDQCEVPPSYAGGQTTSVATVTYPGAGNVATLNFYTDPTSAALQLATGLEPPTGLVRPGDLIQLNCQGPLYTVALPSGTINPVDANGYVTGATFAATFDTSQGQIVPWTGAPVTVSYQIFRSPTMTKGAATPLQLPATTVVDLDASGIDNGAAAFNPFSAGGADVAILFSPNGSVYGVFVGGALTFVTQPIFLMVGKRERVGNRAQTTLTAANDPSWANFQDLNNLWVIINPQTGLVTSDVPIPVSTVSTDPNYVAPTDPSYAPKALDVSRRLARQGVGMGGK